jgi:hypothetical protein
MPACGLIVGTFILSEMPPGRNRGRRGEVAHKSPADKELLQPSAAPDFRARTGGEPRLTGRGHTPDHGRPTGLGGCEGLFRKGERGASAPCPGPRIQRGRRPPLAPNRTSGTESEKHGDRRSKSEGPMRQPIVGSVPTSLGSRGSALRDRRVRSLADTDPVTPSAPGGRGAVRADFAAGLGPCLTLPRTGPDQRHRLEVLP